MSKKRKESEERSKGNGSKTSSLREPRPPEAPYWIDNDLQVPYNASPALRPSPEDLLVDGVDGEDQVPYKGQEQTHLLEYLILDLDLEPRICDILLPPSESETSKQNPSK
jgi:hypothetical protein